MVSRKSAKQRADKVLAFRAYTIREASALLAMSPSSLRRKCALGEMPHHKHVGSGFRGGHIFITQKDMADYLETTANKGVKVRSEMAAAVAGAYPEGKE